MKGHRAKGGGYVWDASPRQTRSTAMQFIGTGPAVVTFCKSCDWARVAAHAEGADRLADDHEQSCEPAHLGPAPPEVQSVRGVQRPAEAPTHRSRGAAAACGTVAEHRDLPVPGLSAVARDAFQEAGCARYQVATESGAAMTTHDAPRWREVPCPDCPAIAGQRCRRPARFGLTPPPHISRRQLADQTFEAQDAAWDALAASLEPSTNQLALEIT